MTLKKRIIQIIKWITFSILWCILCLIILFGIFCISPHFLDSHRFISGFVAGFIASFISGFIVVSCSKSYKK